MDVYELYLQNLQGIVDFHKANPNSPLHPNDLMLIEQAVKRLREKYNAEIQKTK